MRKITLVLVSVLVSLSLVLFFSCDTVGTSGPAPASYRIVIPGDFLGVVHGGNAGSADDIEYDFMDYLGAKWILQTFYWNDFEATQGAFNFPEKYENWTAWAATRGFKMFAVLAYEANWLESLPNGKDSYIQPDHYDKYGNYVTKIIEHYGDKLGGYSIWNEPNENPRFWTGTAEEMWALTKTAASAARQAISQYNPGGKLIAGALNSLAPDIWTRGFFVSGAMTEVDAIAYHPYMPNGRDAALLTGKFRDVVSRYGFGDKIWITEMGFPTDGANSSCVEEDRMPEEVVKTIVLLAAGGVQHVFWYQLFDPNTQNAENSENWFGLAYYKPATNPDGITKKKGADAYALCGKYIQGTTYRGDLSIVSGVGDVAAYYFEGKNGARTLVVWAEKISATATTDVRITLPGSGWKQYSLGDSGAWDPAGSVDDLGQDLTQGNNVYSVGKTPLFFTWTAESAASTPRITAP
jgi:hypothetical protein